MDPPEVKNYSSVAQICEKSSRVTRHPSRVILIVSLHIGKHIALLDMEMDPCGMRRRFCVLDVFQGAGFNVDTVKPE